MRVYLDTEFADWDDPDTDLISLALVAEDGREFYAERTDFDVRKCTGFVRLHVLPLLGAPGVLRLNEAGLKRAVLEWLVQISAPIIAVDYDGDWFLLERLLGEDIPEGMAVANICTFLEKEKLDAYYEQHRAPRHHALHDARANRFAL